VKRYGVAAGLVLVLLVATFAGVRVFRPADTVDAAHAGYPPVVPALPGVYGELLRTPLVVAGRLRVYGAANRVWADGPVDAAMSTSAYWAFRRWPAQLVGVVVAGDRIVVSQWSDGQLVALRWADGRVAWRVNAGTRTATYQGRRTGARTVYAPPDLYTVTGSDGRSLVVATSLDTVTAVDADTGAVRWRRPAGADPACWEYFTAPGIVAAVHRCHRPSTVDVYDAATGNPRTWPALGGATRPVGCAVGRSECTGLAGPSAPPQASAQPAAGPASPEPAAPGWLIGPDGNLTAARGLSSASSASSAEDRLVGHTVVRSGPDGQVRAYDAVTGAPRWSWPVEAAPVTGTRVVAVEPDRVHVVTRAHDVVTLELSNGRELSYFSGQIKEDVRPWTPGYGYAARGYLVVERVQPDVPVDRPDSEYYFAVPSVLFTGS
jgi:outer membrane protein assembly factor BamB